jgi:L-cysteine:1D-myo-inositol 2-amino-2-deoxy-alpha-D-glucopyranoside ligase
MGASHAQVLTGEHPFAQAYVHAGMVALNGEKMSKSKGNLVFVSTLRREGVDPAAIRLALLSRHYRADWEWTDEVLQEAVARLGRWRSAVSRPDGPSADTLVEEIRDALGRDLDAPAALAAVDRWAERQHADGGTDEGAPGLVSRAVDALLGVAL